MSATVMTFRRLVKPEDLNPANFLFGGRIMEWADEAGALYAIVPDENEKCGDAQDLRGSL